MTRQTFAPPGTTCSVDSCAGASGTWSGEMDGACAKTFFWVMIVMMRPYKLWEKSTFNLIKNDNTSDTYEHQQLDMARSQE